MVSLIPRQPAKVFFFHFSAENLNCQTYLTISHTHTHRHADREAEPKDYDVCAPGVERNLLKATYTRIGNIDGVSYKHITGKVEWFHLLCLKDLKMMSSEFLT